MNLGRQLVAFAIALELLFAIGCAKKQPQLPTQATAPAETIPSNLPPEISEETPPPPPPPAPAPEAPPPEEPKPKPVQHHKHKTTPPPAVTAQNNNPSPAAPANNSTTTMAAAHPPANPAAEAAPDTAIAADVSSAQLTQQKQTTAQLIDDTQKTINGLNGRGLSHDEQEIVVQIRSYVNQSLDATKQGDFERAYNLATKAHLLSAALVKK